jgi:S-adenosylmethionine:diacylglycerol 3-amino-3-carboxypropyl transferase
LNKDPLGYLERLIEVGLARHPLFAHQVLDPRRPLPEDLQPPHLRPGEFDGLRDRGSRVRVLVSPRGTREVVLPTANDELDGAYLSNVVDYLSAPERLALFKEVKRLLKPNAPILVYSNEAFAKVPVEAGFVYDGAMSSELSTADRARIYARVEIYRPSETPLELAPAQRAGRLRVIG